MLCSYKGDAGPYFQSFQDALEFSQVSYIRSSEFIKACTYVVQIFVDKAAVLEEPAIILRKRERVYRGRQPTWGKRPNPKYFTAKIVPYIG